MRWCDMFPLVSPTQRFDRVLEGLRDIGIECHITPTLVRGLVSPALRRCV
jgi:hypothetical protein